MPVVYRSVFFKQTFRLTVIFIKRSVPQNATSISSILQFSGFKQNYAQFYAIGDIQAIITSAFNCIDHYRLLSLPLQSILSPSRMTSQNVVTAFSWMFLSKSCKNIQAYTSNSRLDFEVGFSKLR